MANIQIYQLDNVGSDLDSGALLACDVDNPDTSSEIPKVTRKVSLSALETQMLNDEEYTTELNTTKQTIFGAINEHHSVIGYNYDAYDDTATYAVGDLCIYNNTLYKCTTAITTAEAWDASHWTATSIADEISVKEDNLSKGTLASGVDLDDLKNNGIYWTPNSGLLNAPINAYGVLEVWRGGLTSNIIQRFTRFATNGQSYQYDTYLRMYANSQWYQWRQIITMS